MELPSELVQNTVKQIIKERGFDKYDIDWSEGSKKGDNFMGVLYKIKITGTKQNGVNETLNLFCKVPQDTEVMRKDFELNESFKREIMMYGEVLKDFENLEKDKGILNTLLHPKCIASNDADFKEFIIMEDLSTQGFVLFDRLKPIDFDHAQLVMKELGRFHSFSFALKDQRPDDLRKYESRLFELLIKDPFEGAKKSFIETFLKSAVDTLEFEGIYKEKWEYFHQNFVKLMRFAITGASAEPFAVINHGDSWINNILFKYESGKPTELRFVDFQLCRYSSVACDIGHFIFCCTDKAFRDQHYKTLLNDYHESLSNSLKALGSDPEKLFPKSAFEEQMRKFGLAGLGLGLIDIPVIVSKPENAPTIEVMISDVSGVTQNKNQDYVKQRISEVVVDMVDLGYL